MIIHIWQEYEPTRCGKYMVWFRVYGGEVFYDLKETGVVPIGGGGIRGILQLLNRNKVDI